MFVIWMSVHRSAILAVTCLCLWLFADYWYLRFDIKKFFLARKPRKWSVDMATKTSEGGRKVRANH